MKIEFVESYIFADETEMVPSSLPSYQLDRVNSIAGITEPGIPNVLRSILSTYYGLIHADADADASSFDATEAGRTFSL